MLNHVIYTYGKKEKTASFSDNDDAIDYFKTSMKDYEEVVFCIYTSLIPYEEAMQCKHVVNYDKSRDSILVYGRGKEPLKIVGDSISPSEHIVVDIKEDIDKLFSELMKPFA